MKKFIFIQFIALSLVCLWSCSKESPYQETDRIEIAIYDGTPQLEYFKQILNREWKKAGLPDKDASLLIYDGVFYSALRAKDILQPFAKIPDF